MKRALTVKNIFDKKYTTLTLSSAFQEAFGEVEKTGVWFIWGKSGNGKSSFAIQLAKELCNHGRVLYVGLEEGSSITFRNLLSICGMQEIGSRFTVLEPENITNLSEELVNRLKKQRSADFVIIDSFQYTGWDFKKYLAFKKAIARKKMIIIISQTKGNMPLGRTALSVQFDACMKIWVEGFKAFSKGRFIGNNGGEYIINEEKSQRYAESI